MQRHIEVRCCCTPTKLLGWIPVEVRGPGPEDLRQSYDFAVAVHRGAWLAPEAQEAPACAVVRVTLPVASFGIVLGRYPALKSEETPIEILRMLPGFVENTTGESFIDPETLPFEVVR